jgi:hypothetical protein
MFKLQTEERRWWDDHFDSSSIHAERQRSQRKSNSIEYRREDDKLGSERIILQFLCAFQISACNQLISVSPNSVINVRSASEHQRITSIGFCREDGKTGSKTNKHPARAAYLNHSSSGLFIHLLLPYGFTNLPKQINLQTSKNLQLCQL